MSNAEYVLEAVDITKTFPGVRGPGRRFAALKPGTVHALMGENGAGKSTLMKCIYGIYSPDAGAIRTSGEKIGDRKPQKCHGSGNIPDPPGAASGADPECR